MIISSITIDSGLLALFRNEILHCKYQLFYTIKQLGRLGPSIYEVRIFQEIFTFIFPITSKLVPLFDTFFLPGSVLFC